MTVNTTTNNVDLAGNAVNVTQLGVGTPNVAQGAPVATIYAGSGAPTFTAAQGSLYLNTAGSGIANRLYVNTTGSTTWTNFTSAA